MAGRRRIPLRDLLARGPVLGRARRAAILDAGPSGVAYTGPVAEGPPVMPLQVFGAPYDLDLVLVTDHPDWDMHELARLNTPDGPVWLCKDSRAGTLRQELTADVDGLERWLPEIPLARHRAPVEVVDRSLGHRLDLEITWTNPDGEIAHATYVGAPPRGPLWLRNSSTMGHSRDQVLVALDLSARSLARRATLSIGGQPQRLRRILGLVPFAVALVQTQAGLSTGRWRQQRTDLGVRTTHGDVVQAWDVATAPDGVRLVQRHAVRTLEAHFRADGDALELAALAVHAHDGTPVCRVSFGPTLPDARRPFDGVFRGRWVLDVGEQRAHATGTVAAAWQGGAYQLAVRPTSPRWTRDRPLDATVRPVAGGHEVVVTRA